MVLHHRQEGRRARVPSDSGLVDERLPAGEIPSLHHHLHPSDADGLAITGEAQAILEARPTDTGPPPHVVTNAPELQAAEHLRGVVDPPEHGTDATKPRILGRRCHPMRGLKVEKEDPDEEILWQQHQWQ